METKTCSICGQKKRTEDFRNRRYHCRKCRNESSIKYYFEHHDKQLLKSKEYIKANKDKLNEIHKCQCGGSYKLANKTRHERTHKHMNFTNDIVI